MNYSHIATFFFFVLFLVMGCQEEELEDIAFKVGSTPEHIGVTDYRLANDIYAITYEWGKIDTTGGGEFQLYLNDDTSPLVTISMVDASNYIVNNKGDKDLLAVKLNSATSCTFELSNSYLLYDKLRAQVKEANATTWKRHVAIHANGGGTVDIVFRTAKEWKNMCGTRACGFFKMYETRQGGFTDCSGNIKLIDNVHSLEKGVFSEADVCSCISASNGDTCGKLDDILACLKRKPRYLKRDYDPCL